MTSTLRATRGLELACFACCAFGLTPCAHAEPFATRDQNPFVTLFGLPTPLPARGSGNPTSLAIDFNAGNSALIEEARAQEFLVDAETHELRLTLDRRLGERWALRLELPYRYVGAGVLDGFIERYHHTFGFNNGDRNFLQDDRFRIAYARNGRLVFDQRSSTQGFADLVLSAGYQWLATPRSAASLWIGVKAPTGEPSKLTGSGATDVIVAAVAQREIAPSWNVFGQLAVTRLGQGRVLPELQREVLPSALTGVTYRATDHLELQLQLDYHGSVFRAPGLTYLGSARLLTLGGAYQFDNDWRFEVGLSEDIKPEASPDVTLSLGLKRGF